MVGVCGVSACFVRGQIPALVSGMEGTIPGRRRDRHERVKPTCGAWAVRSQPVCDWEGDGVSIVDLV